MNKKETFEYWNKKVLDEEFSNNMNLKDFYNNMEQKYYVPSTEMIWTKLAGEGRKPYLIIPWNDFVKIIPVFLRMYIKNVYIESKKIIYSFKWIYYWMY